MIPLGMLASSRVASGGPVVAAYQGTATTTSTALTSTFAAMPIGTPSATRTVVVGLTWRSPASTTRASVTVGGIAATLDQSTRSSSPISTPIPIMESRSWTSNLVSPHIS